MQRRDIEDNKMQIKRQKVGGQKYCLNTFRGGSSKCQWRCGSGAQSDVQ